MTKSRLCPLDGLVETHEHIYRHCKFTAFAIDTVRKAFKLPTLEDGTVLEPSRILAEHPLQSLTTTQGLLLWTAAHTQWALRCAKQFQGADPNLDDFVAAWLCKLEIWRSHQGCTLQGRDLGVLIGQLLNWQVHRTMFPLGKTPQKTGRPRVQQPGEGEGQQQPPSKKEKYQHLRESMESVIDQKIKEGWVVVYTDGSSKVVRGWRQAGFGGWYGENSPRNFSEHVPVQDRQSNNRAELCAVLWVLQHKTFEEKLHCVLDAEIVYKGITIWMDKWHRHRWGAASGPVGHADLWSKVHFLVKAHAESLTFQWVPSHTDIRGNEEADQLAEKGREKHPDNMVHKGKRLCAQALEEVGLELISSGSSEERGSSVDSGRSQGEEGRGLGVVGLEVMSSGDSSGRGSSIDSGRTGDSKPGGEGWGRSSTDTQGEWVSETTTDSEGFSSVESGGSLYSVAVSEQVPRAVKRRKYRGESTSVSSGG